MIELAAGDLRVALDPETGGAISAFTYRGIEVLRPVRDERLRAQQRRAVAAYPLIPFANRVGLGRFVFEGRQFQLAPNFGDEPHAIHGNAWMHPWTVVEHGATDARLVLDFQPLDDLARQWPFAYRAEQGFLLRHDALCLTMTVRNTDERAFPAGIGLHPYVARTPATVLRFEADVFWTCGKDGLPDAREAAHGRMEFDDAKLIGLNEIDACYAGWGGMATVARPEDGIVVAVSSSPPMDHLQLYTPAERDFIGLEPVSNMPDAINRMEDVADHGLVVLQPGQELRAVVEIGIRLESD